MKPTAVRQCLSKSGGSLGAPRPPNLPSSQPAFNSFHCHSMSTYCVPGTGLSIEVTKTNSHPNPPFTHSLIHSLTHPRCSHSPVSSGLTHAASSGLLAKNKAEQQRPPRSLASSPATMYLFVSSLDGQLYNVVSTREARHSVCSKNHGGNAR